VWRWRQHVVRKHWLQSTAAHGVSTRISTKLYFYLSEKTGIQKRNECTWWMRVGHGSAGMWRPCLVVVTHPSLRNMVHLPCAPSLSASTYSIGLSWSFASNPIRWHCSFYCQHVGCEDACYVGTGREVTTVTTYWHLFWWHFKLFLQTRQIWNGVNVPPLLIYGVHLFKLKQR
jgi:hypothetical protein